MTRSIFTFVLIILIANSSFCQIIHIPADETTIQAGIDAAMDGDTVLVAQNTYFENINFRGKAITVASRFILDGDTSHISKTIIDGSQPSHPDTASVVTFWSGEDSTSVLTGFTITGGSGTILSPRGNRNDPFYFPRRTGGGILIQDAGCKVVRNRIQNNAMLTEERDMLLMGGGIGIYFRTDPFLSPKRVLIQGNDISENEVCGFYAGGGGISMTIDSIDLGDEISIVIENNSVSHNKLIGNNAESGNHGSGVSLGFVLPVRKGEYVLRNNHLHHNSTELIYPNPNAYYEFGTVYVSYFTGKRLLKTHSQPWIYNNIIENNSALKSSAGISVYCFANLGVEQMEIGPFIMNNTVVNNRAETIVTGLGLKTKYTKPLVLNNIFWNSLLHKDAKEFFNDGGLILSHNNIIQKGWPGEGNKTIYPDLNEETFEPMQGSPCIGSGIDSLEIDGKLYYAPSKDFYGNPRPNQIDDHGDIGAIESPYENYVFIPDTTFLYALIDEGVDTNGDSLIRVCP